MMQSNEAKAIFCDAGDRESGVECAHCGLAVERGAPIAQCIQCATVHHRKCWDLRGWCGSYVCQPGRRELATIAQPTAGAWKISSDELSRAIPLPPPRPPFSAAGAPMFDPRPPLSDKRSKMAIATLIVALLGIPLFGVITGVVAIILGAVAISTIARTRQRGMKMAIIGLLLGVVDIIGWAVAIAVLWTPHAPVLVRRPEMELDPAALKTVDPGIADAMRANVVISTTYRLSERMGSGVILKIDPRKGVAHIVTNRHVIDGAYTGADSDGTALPTDELQVRMLGRGRASGKVVWMAPDAIDLAIITVDLKDTAEVRVAKFPAPMAPKIGDACFAVGNPHALGWSLSPGSISQIRRWDGDLIVIQTTAPINSGNSGGGLYDKAGNLIGINTWTEDKHISEGIGFAISIENLLRLAPREMLQLQKLDAEKPPTTETTLPEKVLQ